jgi:hypothetical protein
MGKYFYYKIRGLAKGLDGLVVQTIIDVNSLKPDIFPVPIERIFDIDSIIGDREASVQLPSYGLCIGPGYLESTDDPTKREYDHTSPYGKFLREKTIVFKSDSTILEIAYARFENSLQTTVRNAAAPAGAPKTLYAENFSKDLDRIEKMIYDTSLESSDDLIFRLQEIKGQEVHDGEA